MAEAQQALSEQLTQAKHRLAELESSLHGVQQELDAMAVRREQFASLEDACASLERLREQGIAELFWQGPLEAVNADDHLRRVRTQVAEFQAELDLVLERRAAAQAAINEQLDVVDILDDDLYQAQQEEERRKQEWIIEREADELPPRPQIMPWMRGLEEDRLFRKNLAGALAASVLLGLLIPMIELPIPDLNEPIEVPERLARLIQQEPVPVPPAAPPPELASEEQPEPEPKLEPEPEPETPPRTQQVADVPVPVEQPAPKPKPKGILAFRDNLSNLAQNRPSARLGSQARISTAGELATGLPERAMVTAQGEGSSGGINLASLSRDVGNGGGGQIEGVQAMRVSSSIDAGGGGPDRPRSAGASGGRTDEEIQIVFDRYKAALYRLYNRELRRDPTLRGQIVLKLTIEADGSVSLCRLQSSDMQAPDLVQQVVDRVSGFDFGAKDGIPAVTIVYPIDFLPTA